MHGELQRGVEIGDKVTALCLASGDSAAAWRRQRAKRQGLGLLRRRCWRWLRATLQAVQLACEAVGLRARGLHESKGGRAGRLAL